MRALLCTLFASIASLAFAEIKLEPVGYEIDGTRHQGYIAYNDGAVGKPPGVLVFPEWWGANEYAQSRARMLAELGYVAMVADMYGEGKTTSDRAEAQKLASSVYSNPETLKKRAEAALAALQQSGRGDPSRIAAIGYCMGGTVALNLARAGADLKAVVGFHCGLANVVGETGKIKAKVLICNGADDKMISDEEEQAFEQEMRDGGVDWLYVSFGGALHSFTNPEADKHRDMGSVGYNRNADHRSWRMMRMFLDEALDHRPAGPAERGIGSPR